MRTMTMGWTPRERALLALCVASLGISIAGYLDLGGSAGAAPAGGVGGEITSGEIRDGTIRSADIGPTIRSADIVDGSLQAGDLGLYNNRVPAQRSVPSTVGAFETVIASCDGGDRVISGGFSNTAPQSVGLTMFRDFFTPPGGWIVSGYQFGQTPAVISSFATCLND